MSTLPPENFPTPPEKISARHLKKFPTPPEKYHLYRKKLNPPEIILTPLKFLNLYPPQTPPPRKFLNPPSKISQPPPKISQPPPENFSTPPRKFLNPPPKISQPPRKFLNPPPRKFLNPPPENFSTLPENFSTPPLTSLFFLFLSISFPSLFKKKSENFVGV